MADAPIAESCEVQLEAKRKADGSWHPCQVSLCSGGGLSVKFEGQVSEDMMLGVEDALACLRVRSVPLQGDDCCYIEEGKHVLAAREKNYQKLFLDAVVQKVIRVRHSKRASCRCTFTIKWLFDHAENGISSIPSSSIMKLATENIDSHPTVAAFLSSMEKSHLSTSPSSPTSFDDSESEFDFPGLLKHIEGIGSLTNASNKELLNDSLLGVDHGGRDVRTKLIASEQVNKCVQASYGSSRLRRSARRNDVTQPPIEDLITSVPSSIENSVQNQSPLNPLAARAVLASLVSKFPQKIVNNMESYLTNERGFSDKRLHAKTLNGFPTEVCNNIEPSIDLGGSLSSSMRDEESTLPVEVRRLTRSAMKRESSNTNHDDDTTSVEAATSVRMTRFAAHKRKGNTVEKASEESLDKTIRSTRSTCSAIKKGMEVSYAEDKNRTLDEGAKCTILRSPIRVTRSTARAGIDLTGVLDDKVKETLQAEPENESALPDYSNSDYEAVISPQRRTFQLVNAELKQAESNKKHKVAVERRQKKTAEDLHGNVETQSRKKSVPSKNQPSRCSPRLRCSPGTRSHNKS
ncbi:hypothetical protein SOVF_031150 [Spinacia oleracea]|uniref:Uncharacterized protein isoform X2 n=1 Tax=Spinacia oleracea TaxID=3562 RepID=A0A9R0IPD4_SPIOL|nr:uncharacterized protein LOC110792323 isoform X2 [Spinacia oleracea]KNA22667.1 hypothetical protein SOVF_031150 [Spinacia oleracea]